ncbi:MAG: PAS domain-containing protein, partial [Candidatus Tectomicrobia bacterium]|nr:PAS domain-containing protein [Candidatus Tectomicrobia bacterium]
MADLVKDQPTSAVSLRHTHFQPGDVKGQAYHREPLVTGNAHLSWWPRFTYQRSFMIYGQPFELAIAQTMPSTVVQGWQMGLALAVPLGVLAVVGAAWWQRRVAHLETCKAQLSIAESEQRFRDLIEGSVQGIYIHYGGRPIFVNSAFASMLGYSA